MLFPQNKSLVPKKYLGYIESVKRSDGMRLILTVVFASFFFFILTWHFEYKYLNILSKSSMIDETDTVTFSERREIKDTIAGIYKAWKLPTKFIITPTDLEIPPFTVPTLYIAVNPEKPDVLIYMPSGMGKTRDLMQDNLLTCLQGKEKTLGTCLNDTLLYFVEIIQ